LLPRCAAMSPFGAASGDIAPSTAVAGGEDASTGVAPHEGLASTRRTPLTTTPGWMTHRRRPVVAQHRLAIASGERRR